MFGKSKICRFGAMAIVLSLAATAHAGQKHAGYMRTLDDLRFARALLQRPDRPQTADTPQDEVSLTIANIDRAMDELRTEVGAGGKKSHALPRIDARMTWGARLSESLRALDKAEQDCAREKDDAGNAGMLARIRDQLDQARTRITVAIETVNFDYSARNMTTRND